MKILIIHLSDIHIKKENNSIFKKIDKIKNVFNDVDIIANQIFLVVSGDIVFSGGSNEYNIASDFFDIFIKNVKEVLNIDVNCIIIPGNHDCDFTIKEKNVREILSQEINSKGSAIIDTEVINICCKVQENFCQFYKKYHNGNKLIFNDKLLRIYKFLSNGYAIYFNCFNTSWISHKNEKPGNLFFPSTNYKNILEKTKGHLLISVLHHPFEWQNVNSRWNLLKLVEENSDLIITSHEHRFDKSIKDNLVEMVN